MIDARSLTVIAVTVVLGPPQAAPIAMKMLGPDLGDVLLLLAIGHLGSAAVLFLFFQAIRSLVDRLKAMLSSAFIRIRPAHGARVLPALQLEAAGPGGRYFFMGTVAFVFAFGSFLGVAATQAVGMGRRRGFAAVMVGCGLSVIFWGLAAFYLSKAIDPIFVTLAFVAVAVGLVWRGRILQHRVVAEIRSVGANGLRVLSLVAQGVPVAGIAAQTQLRLQEIGSILEDLVRKGYVTSTGKEIYRVTSRGLDRLSALPQRIIRSLKAGSEEKMKDFS